MSTVVSTNSDNTAPRVLFIARYRDASMHHKVELLAQQGKMVIRYVYPNAWRDDLVQVNQDRPELVGIEQSPVRLVGPMTDPHRVRYRTLTWITVQSN